MSESNDKIPNASTRAAMEEARQMMALRKIESLELDGRTVAIMRAVSVARNGICSADDIAHSIGVRPARSGRLAVTSTLRKLEKADLVHRLAPEDQWSTAKWALKPIAKDYLKSLDDADATPGMTGP